MGPKSYQGMNATEVDVISRNLFVEVERCAGLPRYAVLLEDSNGGIIAALSVSPLGAIPLSMLSHTMKSRSQGSKVLENLCWEGVNGRTVFLH